MSTTPKPPYYELWKDHEVLDENGRTADPVRLGQYPNEAQAIADAKHRKLDLDTHYICRQIVGWQEPGYRPLMDLDEDYGTGGYRYLNDIPELV